MKRIVTVLLVLLLVVAQSPPAAADTEDFFSTQSASFVFPESIVTIEEEAFSGTAADVIVFPHGFTSIGQKAFDAAPHIRDVFIPETVKFIGAKAFPSNAHLRIHGVYGSYAHRWAENHRISFLQSFRWSALHKIRKTLNTQGIPVQRYNQRIGSGRTILSYKRGEFTDRSMRPQDRPELNPIDYRFP